MMGCLGTTSTVLTERDAILAYLADRTEESFCAVARVFTPKLLRYFEVRGAGFSEAEELCQDVLLACYRSAGSLRAPEAFGAWLFRIAHNARLARIRDSQRNVATVAISASANELRDSSSANFARFELEDLLAGISEAEREILALRHMDGLSYEEIAEVLRIPAGTAKWRVFDAKRKLLGRARIRKRQKE
jgi:RNA polymerase sigma-70 factor, ECF subfamily